MKKQNSKCTYQWMGAIVDYPKYKLYHLEYCLSKYPSESRLESYSLYNTLIFPEDKHFLGAILPAKSL